MDQHDQKMWNLLGSSLSPSAPPYFSARVLRRIETMEKSRPDIQTSFIRWFAPATVAALFIVALLPHPAEVELDSLSRANEINALDIVQIVSPEDYAVLTSVDWPSQNDFLSAGM
jgi:hypothetical protein